MNKTPIIAPEFTRTREFIRRYVVLPDEELDVLTVWAMGTWTFSPKCTNPATYPYLYVNAEKGSGKSVLGNDVFGAICRNHRPVVGTTGPALFRMLALFDEETGEVFNLAPTLAIDEIDATFSGNKDEDLRLVLNSGYKRGSTIPRAMGKVSIEYPVYCPKLMMGIDNGHLPATVTDRSIRITLKRATKEEMVTREDFFPWDIEEEATELQAELAAWAVEHSYALREYRPESMVQTHGLAPRQWEISRSLVQLAKEIGVEDRIKDALVVLFNREPEKASGKERMYKSIFNLLMGGDLDRVTSRQIMAQLETDGVQVPGNTMKGLAAVLSENGITPSYLRLPTGHPGILTDPETKKPQPIQRGYFRHQFDEAFARYLEDE